MPFKDDTAIWSFSSLFPPCIPAWSFKLTPFPGALPCSRQYSTQNFWQSTRRPLSHTNCKKDVPFTVSNSHVLFRIVWKSVPDSTIVRICIDRDKLFRDSHYRHSFFHYGPDTAPDFNNKCSELHIKKEKLLIRSLSANNDFGFADVLFFRLLANSIQPCLSVYFLNETHSRFSARPSWQLVIWADHPLSWCRYRRPPSLY